MAAPPTHSDWDHDHLLDAGDTGCGDLIMFLEESIQLHPGGTRFLLLATDFAAATEVGAWCRLTGNRMERSEDTCFLIVRQRTED